MQSGFSSCKLLVKREKERNSLRSFAFILHLLTFLSTHFLSLSLQLSSSLSHVAHVASIAVSSQGQPRDLEIGINTNTIPSGSSCLQSTRACEYFLCMDISTPSSHHPIDCISQRIIASTLMMIVFCCFVVDLFTYSSLGEKKKLFFFLHVKREKIRRDRYTSAIYISS